MAADATLDREQEPRQEAADGQSGNVLIFGPATGPKCAAGEATDDGHCWRELANRSGCFFLDWARDYEITFNWSEACLDGAADGTGTLTWRANNIKSGFSFESEETGEMVQGMAQGHWSYRERYRLADGREEDCSGAFPYVGGKMNGRWVRRCNVKQNNQRWEYERESDCVDGQCEVVEQRYLD